ncbi:hypothetical protein C361_00264 [Cryptococcus neoformans Tu259-1]|uniref:WSC domain-containing protein n=1 Tax=Cryptococcus neoformans Tu259-1 TaxID=1230072 RepID=A0A854QM95_CRYNE|nr:hypothetical protein C353_00269 [Cryptococcus neoformans var. grubii AD1-83a]OXG29830.1 hypothetical protein C361_00264 [Cryptococcus neoformans var. grubii Tu259-1]OXG69500.1 hypothetical protein C351_00265 [Cryptococcus neoformans var. grubii c8]OXG70292.1 hypothetical protein C354_00272 [Cryptococcus neoformans var. grubii MW-RSA1955]OXG73412.1 hypothetical protein C352_00269 [Cryptococcus neoformans var. grubii CHC193]OXH19526.1 hypothetical protein C369_00267 [Cryptococcus neoformans v
MFMLPLAFVFCSFITFFSLLPGVFGSPTPDTIFLLKESSFTSLGCSKFFTPTSILHQVSSPGACFSRCSPTEIAAYTQIQYGVLCSCGGKEMLQGLDAMDPCTGSNWYLYGNKGADENEIIGLEEETRELKDLESAFSRKGRTSQIPMSPTKLRMLLLGKQDRSQILQ